MLEESCLCNTGDSYSTCYNNIHCFSLLRSWWWILLHLITDIGSQFNTGSSLTEYLFDWKNVQLYFLLHIHFIEENKARNGSGRYLLIFMVVNNDTRFVSFNPVYAVLQCWYFIFLRCFRPISHKEIQTYSICSSLVYCLLRLFQMAFP